MGEVAVEKSQSFLKTNLAKRGWKVDGNVATFGDLTLDCQTTGWTLKKGDVDIATGGYGSNQMGDVRKAAAKAGVKFDAVTAVASGPAQRQPLTEEQKQARRAKRNSKKEPGGQNPNLEEPGVRPPLAPPIKSGVEKFKTILSHNEWVEGEDGWTRGDLRVIVLEDRWALLKGDTQLAEGTFADRAYAVIDSQMAKLDLLR